MDATESELAAVALLWHQKHEGKEAPPMSDEDAERLLADVRERARQVEQHAVSWLTERMKKPPRSGFWSRAAPWTGLWMMLAIAAAIGIVYLILAVLTRL
jgi:hypothetical protein